MFHVLHIITAQVSHKVIKFQYTGFEDEIIQQRIKSGYIQVLSNIQNGCQWTPGYLFIFVAAAIDNLGSNWILLACWWITKVKVKECEKTNE